jgi:DNA-binding beta-propeller fold protein YncE
MQNKICTYVCLAVFAALTATSVYAQEPAPAPAQQFYQLESTLSFKSKGSSWDYLTFDPDTSYLYIGRRKEGVTVVNTLTNKIVAELENAKDANGVTLIKDMDLGYTSNEDGTMTMFQISSLKTLKRIKVGGDGDSSVYEPVTKRIFFLQGDSKEIVALDAKTGERAGHLSTPSSKLEAPVADGDGNIFIPFRDKNVVVRLDAGKMKLTAEWPTIGCDEPSAMAWDKTSKRLFVGCRGKNPVLLVMDSENGHVVTSQPIGRGTDKVIFDAETKKIYTANGVDGNLVIIDQINADTYKLSEALGTRPGARTMAMDPKTKKIFLVTAEGTQDQSKKVNRGPGYFYPNRFFPNTFVLLTYSRK